MARPQSARQRWEISTGGLVIGVLIGLFYLFVALGARAALGLVSSFAQSSGEGLTITSNLFDFVNGGIYLALVAALVAVKIAHRAIKSPLTAKGPLKVALGGLTGLFYYFILAGGILSFTVGLQKPASGSFEVAVTLLVTLALLEISAAMKVLQGVFELRDGRRETSAQVPVARQGAEGTSVKPGSPQQGQRDAEGPAGMT
jgi:hypothetical protein